MFVSFYNIFVHFGILGWICNGIGILNPFANCKIHWFFDFFPAFGRTLTPECAYWRAHWHACLLAGLLAACLPWLLVCWLACLLQAEPWWLHYLYMWLKMFQIRCQSRFKQQPMHWTRPPSRCNLAGTKTKNRIQIQNEKKWETYTKLPWSVPEGGLYRIPTADTK